MLLFTPALHANGKHAGSRNYLVFYYVPKGRTLIQLNKTKATINKMLYYRIRTGPIKIHCWNQKSSDVT